MKPKIRLTNLEKCSFLQRKIIIHSIIYYELNESILTDQEFDKMCRKLLKGIQYTKNYQRSDYFYVFYYIYYRKIQNLIALYNNI